MIEIHQSIWQTAAIYDSENVFLLSYDIVEISCNKILPGSLNALVLHPKKGESLFFGSVNFYHQYSISGPTLVAISFSIHFEVWQFSVRKRIWSFSTFTAYSQVINSQKNYSKIVCFRSNQIISVSIQVNVKFKILYNNAYGS